ncbi:MAG: hypothetical protein ACRYFX_03885 [Janthinobacterium lividum]
MTLGVYWYFGFPEGLYHFRYFTFSPGLGGHADGPAELTARVTVPDLARFTQALMALLAQHPGVYLFGYQRQHELQIITGGYHLYDYDFGLIGKVDALLQAADAQAGATAVFTEAERIVWAPMPAAETGYSSRGLLQLGGSGQHKHHAETSALRLDCHLPTTRQPQFISTLRELAQAANLHVFFYYFHQLKTETNLMLFFTNGRQGIDLQPKQDVDIQRFEQEVKAALQAHGGQPEHRGGHHQYPETGPIIELITDQDYVL